MHFSINCYKMQDLIRTWLKLQLEKCAPLPGLQGGHAQTLLGHFFPSPQLSNSGERFQIQLADGDKLCGNLLRGYTDTVVYLFHGLSGSTDSNYIQRIARSAQANGHSVILANHRGCGWGEGLAKNPYHSGRSEDLSEYIAYGRSLFPQKRHLAIGFSLSANALLLLAAGVRAKALPDAAITVNAPINLKRAAQLLNQGLNRIYDINFVFELRRQVKGRAEIPIHATTMEFDNLYTAPAAGFRDREDYYEKCSGKQFIKDIKIPTIVMTAADDPFVDVTDYREISLKPNIHWHIEKLGGHLGYLSRNGRWMDYAISQWIEKF